MKTVFFLHITLFCLTSFALTQQLNSTLSPSEADQTNSCLSKVCVLIEKIIANLTFAQEKSLSQIITRLNEDAAKSDSQIEMLKEEIRINNNNYIKLLEIENERTQNETANILEKTSEIITKSNQDLFNSAMDFNLNLSNEMTQNTTQEINQLIIEMRRLSKNRIVLMELKLDNIIRDLQKNKISQHDHNKRKSKSCSKRRNN